MKRLRPIAMVLALGGLFGLAACGSSASQGSGAAGAALTISNESGSLWTCGFNPFNPDVNFQSIGTVYETLDFVNTLKSGDITPWLASAYAWSDGNKTLTFTIRPGVKWSDGKPFSAADVVYTFELMKKHPALDLNAVWSVLSSVAQVGTDEVRLTFSESAVPYFYFIAGQVAIVPEHIWDSVSNPVTWADAKPVGTGPYVVHQCTPQNVQYTANPTYWQTGLPKVKTVNYPAFTSNTPANNYLAQGQAQWGGQYIPNIDAFYASKSPDNHYWFPPTSNVDIFPNLTVAPLNDVAVRQAMAYALDRPKISKIGETGYEPPSNQTGIVLPTFGSWYDASASAAYGDYSYDPAKAESILEHAGFVKGSNGIFHSASGTPLSFTIINIGDYSDWVASLSVIQGELQAVGIAVTVENLSSNDYDADLYTGKYQLAYGAEVGGPSPYYEYRQLLYSKNSAPIGQTASSNWERFDSSAADQAIDAYGATTDVATQHQLTDQLQQIMLQDVPVIPTTEQVDWYQYNTGSFGGWPTSTDPYAQPAPFNTPDIEVVLLHLYPKS